MGMGMGMLNTLLGLLLEDCSCGFSHNHVGSAYKKNLNIMEPHRGNFTTTQFVE